MSATTGVLRRATPAVREVRALAAGRRGRRALIWGLPALLALIYLIALLANFGAVITSINMNSDASIALVLAKLLGQAPAGSHVLLGNHPYYEEFLFLRATAGLPGYRQLWDIAPFLWTLAGAAILGWSARIAVGSFGAMLSVSAVIALGAAGRFMFFTFDWHGLSVVHTIVIGAVLVWLAPRAASLRWSRLVVLAIALGLISALPVASDKLFPFWALIPLLVTCLLMAWRGAGRARVTLPVFAAVTILVAALGGALIAHVMRSNGIGSAPFGLTFVPPGHVLSNAGLLLGGYMNLGGGYFLSLSPGFLGYCVFASGALVVGAFALGLVEVRRLAAAGGIRPASGSQLGPKLPYVVFWASSLLVQVIVFVFSSAPADNLSVRYALAGYVAIAALSALLALRGPGWRILVTTGVCVFVFSSTYQLIRQPFAPGSKFPGPRVANAVLRFARANDVRYGYSGYWDAADLTWLTRFQLEIYPVDSNCGPDGLCPAPNTQIDTWYRPRPGIRSMLIADPKFPGVMSLEPRLGAPLAQTQVGNLTVAVYPFDIAAKLGVQ